MYGAGNKAAYNASGKSTYVNINHIKNGHSIAGNVYGGGYGATATVTANTSVTIGDGTGDHYAVVAGNVYGGGELAEVHGNTSIKMQNGHSQVTDIFGGGHLADMKGVTTVDIKSGTVNNNVYGGGALAKVGTDGEPGGSNVTLEGTAVVMGDLFGGGLGQAVVGDTIPARVYGPIQVTVKGGTADEVFGCNNVWGSPQTSVNVTVEGGTMRNVYGGGNEALAIISPSVEIKGGTISGSVFGGGDEAGVGSSDGTTTVTINGGAIVTGVYGGCHQQGTVTGHTYVNLTSGTVGNSGTRAAGIFGGGLGQTTGVSGNVTVTLNGATLYSDLYGGSALGSVNSNNSNTTTINILDGTIVGNVYGGGLGQKNGVGGATSDILAAVNGKVYVNIGADDGAGNYSGNAIFNTYTESATTKGGSVFGCNNINGSPADNVYVNIYKTRQEGNNALSGTGYDIYQVFGGGDQSDFTPTGKSVNTYIYSCNNTIRRVFGGGNAAAVKDVNLTIDGGRIYRVYGGGNGEVTPADVNGHIELAIHGGNVDKYFENSNVSGNITGGSHATVDNTSGCGELKIDEYFVCGSLADFHGNKSTVITCSQNMSFGSIYGGAEKANVYGNIDLTIEGGTFTNVYGGSKGKIGSGGNELDTAANIYGNVTLTLKGGTMTNVFGGCNVLGNITGKIIVNVNDAQNSNCPLIIHNLYGGGRDAAYTPTTADAYPEVNILRGTISKSTAGNDGNVYGGGLGSEAVVHSNPIVTIGDMSHPAYVATVEGNVYGGGEEANIDGNTTVIIQQSHSSAANIFGGGNRANVDGATTINVTDGTVIKGVYGGCNNTGNIAEDINVYINGGTVGADGIGNGANVHGGGYGTSTTAGKNVNVIIGNSNATTPVIYGAIYGGGALGSVNGTEANTSYHTHVTLHKGTVNGDIYGGGLGSNNTAALVYSPVQVTVKGGTVTGGVYGCNNINGAPQQSVNVDIYGTDAQPATGYAVGTVFGGGNKAEYTFGTPLVTVHNCNASIGTVYGGGNAAKVPATDVTIYGGNRIGTVYGGGNGEGVASNFVMVDTNINVKIYGGIISNVFGGNNTSGNIQGTVTVTLDAQAEPSKAICPMSVTNVYGGGNQAVYSPTLAAALSSNYSPLVNLVKGTVTGNVFGGGKGSAESLTAGGVTTSNPKVSMTGTEMVVRGNIYGGGELASVGNYTAHDASGKPTACATGTGRPVVEITSGTVGAESMPANFLSEYTGSDLEGDRFVGMVFGGGKGITGDPATSANIPNLNYVDYTDVTISGSAFIKGSVYGGSQNGHVLHDTYVKIQGGQIGCGAGETEPYAEGKFIATPVIEVSNGQALAECPSWPYGQAASAADKYEPYDKYTRPVGDDGHTFYGNVFGGGSGYFPYASGQWLRSAGCVEGSTKVEITGGHILTSIYGGNEFTDVTGDSCVVIMTGGTLGVPRTLSQIAAHPVTCYLFGAGKGDPRTQFNAWTNVKDVRVTVGGTAKIYGSVFGGGEDGHVIRNVKLAVNGGNIGTTGTSYVDGNIFGGGRGFSGEALTAGNVGGDVTVNISGGKMFGSVYGGGRLASVGYGLYASNDERYGKIRPDNQDDNGNQVSNFSRGHIYINIYGDAVIGNEVPSESSAVHPKGGNVFGGSMGRLVKLDNSYLLDLWQKLGCAKQTTINIYGNAKVRSNVYGGSELGSVTENTTVNIYGNAEIGHLSGGNHYHGNVYGGGYGSPSIPEISDADVRDTVKLYSGRVYKETQVNITDGTVHGSIYGGGEMATIGTETVSVYGNTTVNIGSTDGAANPTYSGDAVIYGNVYGANNESGTPLGNAYVNIYKNHQDVGVNAFADAGYALKRVFGGGNKAHYVPTDQAKRAIVHVYGCANSIEDVFGGGDAADAYGVTVTVDGGRIHRIFGGGNGEGGTVANIGDGSSILTVSGGTIDQIFGGCNKQGSVGGANSKLTVHKTQGACPMYIGEVYGGGNEAEGNAVTVNIKNTGALTSGHETHNNTDNRIGYQLEGINSLYGGANKANVTNGIALNIENGIIDSIFGGNNVSGNISGDITISIQRDRTTGYGWYVGNVFGGGNQAVYAGTPKVYVKNGEVDNVYGGGNGSSTDNTKGSTGGTDVTIGDENGDHYAVVKGNVYGGGNAAMVSGSTKVTYNDNNASSSIARLFGGGNAAGVTGTASVVMTAGTVTSGIYGGCNTKGTIEGKITVDAQNGTIATVFGGGYGVDTKTNGDVEVTIGTASAGPTISGNVYGGSALGSVNNATTDSTIVNILGGTLNGDIYGGGLGEKDGVGGGTQDIAALVGGIVTVNIGAVSNPATYIGNATINGSVFGCNYINGSPMSDVTVNIFQTAHTSNNYIPSTPAGGWTATKLAENSATQTYAIKSVYGGGNLAAYTPEAGHGTTVHVYSCNNTIEDLYGGGNAADVGTASTSANTTVIVDGGRLHRVFGGGNGQVTAADIHGTATTTLYAGLINQVFGGSNTSGSIDYTHLNIAHDDNNTCDVLYSEVFGGGNQAVLNGDLTTTIECGAGSFGDFYGGANEADITGDVTLNIKGGTFVNVFGGSRGSDSKPANILKTAGGEKGNVVLNLYGGTITNAYGGSNINGNIEGTITVNVLDQEGTCALDVTNIYGAGRLTAYTPALDAQTASPVVNVKHIKQDAGVRGNVYGGAYGDTATVTANPKVTIGDNLTTHQTKVAGVVYGGGEKAPVVGNTSVIYNDNNASSTVTRIFGGGNQAGVTGSDTIRLLAGSVTDGIFGGCNVNGTLMGDIFVYIDGGQVGTDATHRAYGIFGGGYGENTSTDSNVSVIIGNSATLSPVIYGDVYGGSAKGNVNNDVTDITKVWFKRGTVTGDIYGGGFGDDNKEALVKGNVQVVIDGGTMDTITTGGGRVFGGNNLNGTPKGTVEVTVNATQPSTGSGDTKKYALKGVYGGGNMAHYNPATSNNGYPVVTVNGCATSIENVFGGANAAAVPQASVIVNGGDIKRVFAGGNGTEGNAHVGYRSKTDTTDAYGTGNASVTIHGGTIVQVFGGSNMQGAIRGSNSVEVEKTAVACEMHLTEVYGGGNESPSKSSNISINCTGGDTEGIQYLYGGANKADVKGNIQLDITAGHIENVFGGNNQSGTISGTITVNIDSTEDCSWYIGNVYGGGNQATYGTAGSNYPSVNILAGTVSYDVFGGGLGKEGDATKGVVTGNPRVIVNGAHAIVNGGVYGGGSLAPTTGNPVVTLTDGHLTNVFGGGKAAGVKGATQVTINGGSVSTGVYGGCHNSGTISGLANVYVNGGQIGTDADHKAYGIFGGGYGENTSTDSSISVIIGNSATLSPVIYGDVYGGSAKGNVNNETTEITKVQLKKGTITGDIYGGGFGDGGADAHVNGIVQVLVSGGTVDNVYGGNNLGGAPQRTIQVDISGGTVNQNVFGGGNQAAYIAPTTDNLYPQVNINSGTVGNVFGGGKGASATVSGHPRVTIGDLQTVGGQAVVTGHVYGGGDLAPVTGSPLVTIQKENTSIAGNVFGGGNKANVSDSTIVNVTGGTVTKDVYGGGALAQTGGTTVTLTGGKVRNFYGGGLGNTDTAATVNGTVFVSVKGGIADTVFGCNNINGAPTSTVQVDIDKPANSGAISYVFGGGNHAAYSNATLVNLKQGVVTSLFGGGNQASVGSSVVNMLGGTVDTVFGGGNMAGVAGTISVNLTSGTINKGLYGGCDNSGVVDGDIAVNITGGTVGMNATNTANIHGGGYGNSTSTSGDAKVTINGNSINVWGDVYGGSAKGHVNNDASDSTLVTLRSGIVHGDLYGGGLGDENNEASVNGQVQVTVYGGTVTGSVYGCNNVKGAPTASVKVDIYGTDAPTSGYALANVFGGGNHATYVGTPVVTIHNCDNSIGYVYGGGNKASVTGADVTIYGGNTIGYVFGGGNGEGVAVDYPMVTGNVSTKIYGGTIGHVFGGNNQSGTIGGIVTLTVNKQAEAGHSACPMYLGEVYGGGNLAAGNAGVVSIVCTGTIVDGPDGHIAHPERIGTTLEGIATLYGGANQADVTGDITLTINSGIINNVFGGNNTSGSIAGSIEVNIDSNSNACGWYVGDVFGGGNKADYGGTPDVNILAGTIYRNVYGGGNEITTTGKGVLGSDVNMTGGTVRGNLYGGCNIKGTVETTSKVTLTGGSVMQSVYGGGYGSNTTVTGKATVDISGDTSIGEDVYGGGNEGTVEGGAEVNIH